MYRHGPDGAPAARAALARRWRGAAMPAVPYEREARVVTPARDTIRFLSSMAALARSSITAL